MGTIKEAFCKNFTRLVESSDLTQKAIAQKLEVTEPTFYRWKSGENAVPLDKLDQLARILNIDPVEFYKSEETPKKVLTISELRNFMGAIPDDVYNMSQILGPDHQVWEIVRGAYDHAVKSRKEKESKERPA